MEKTEEKKSETTKEAYKAKMEAQLKVWSTQLEGITAKADKATADAKVELLKHADEFKALETSAKKHLADVEAAAADSWHTVKTGIEETWDKLAGSVEAIWAKVTPGDKSKN